MDPKLAMVLSAGGRGRGKRSPLYLFMRRHFVALTADFEANGPRWDVRTKAFGEAGLTDRDGKPPTVRTAQQTWYQLKQDLARQAAKPRPANVPAPPPLASSPPPAPVAGDEDDAERTGPRFGFAKPRA
ncbi:hypothetical protein [Muricoccus radiodurans]|uniref:hypothetical protein n=1 Tax=Muricoccus radiodurans TaxID=2231721 RepID=UPI003CE68771